MKKFSFTSQVERTVVDTISLQVYADNETEAYEKAERLLYSFPSPTETEDIDYCFIENREPREVKILTIDKEENA